MKELIKQSSTLLLFLAILILSPLMAVEKKVRVTAEKAYIYAEAHAESYKIEIVRKGTILTVFDSGEAAVSWYYVSYRSKRWGSQVTGFIQASMVEEISDKAAEDIPPKIEKPEVIKAKAKPKVEQIMVTESVGVSDMPPSKSYALPVSGREKKPRLFLSIDSTPAAAEKLEKKDESLSDITKKIPDTLRERQPPEVLVIKPEPEGKKEETKKEEPKKTKPEKKQVIPKIRPEKPLFTFGAGYGPSGGSGIGGFVQFNTKKNISFHLGAGYYPTTYFYSQYEWAKNQFLFSAGLKYYLPFKTDRIRTYVDLQYGGISVEAVRVVTGIWHYQYTYENIQKTLFGPSLLAGLELRLGKFGLNGAIGLSYNTTEWDYWERDYYLTVDVEFLIYLW